MSTLNRQPPRVPMVDPKTGLITREWDRYFTDSFTRMGGADAPTNSELDVSMPEDSGVAELEMLARSIDNEYGQAPSQVPFQINQAYDEIGQGPQPSQQAAGVTDYGQEPPLVLLESVEALQTQVREMSEQIVILRAQITELQQGTML